MASRAVELEGARRLLSAGRAGEAASRCRGLLRADPKDADALDLLARALGASGDLAGAVERHREAAEARPGDARLRHNLGMALRRAGRLDEAIAAMDEAMRLGPVQPATVAARADYVAMRGEYESAWATLAPMVEAGTLHAGVALAMARIARRVERVDEAIAYVEACLGAEPSMLAREGLLFALGGLLDARGEHGRAFDAWEAANRLHPVRFDSAAHSAAVDRVIAGWSEAAVASMQRSGEGSEVPVFVVGMPRSGTSLVDQILSSHPRVEGRGELGEVGRMAAELAGGGQGAMVESPARLRRAALDRMARRYLKHIGEPGEGVLRVSDKNPLNFLHVGLIAAMLPGARIVWSRRGALDTCVSCYSLPFAGPLDFAYDLASLGRYWVDCERLMEHWMRVLPGRVHAVEYEQLVSEQERETRALVAAAGLEWDEACLAFHESERVMRTASNEQVRRPMYATSVGRWERYADRLGPLRAALGDRAG